MVHVNHIGSDAHSKLLRTPQGGLACYLNDRNTRDCCGALRLGIRVVASVPIVVKAHYDAFDAGSDLCFDQAANSYREPAIDVGREVAGNVQNPARHVYGKASR